ncbi:IS66 family insertion sequence element accessory protein TnpA, partial [Thauera aromatica]|uniref:IS66 family insertion sequence element accessory protein TnpA n=1 Tax=Thauera aromatica TaxID=59405 RepID=UPI003CD0DD2E
MIAEVVCGHSWFFAGGRDEPSFRARCALRAARWRAHVEQWRRSGQTQAAYSAEHGLNKKSLGYWVRQGRAVAARKSDA